MITALCLYEGKYLSELELAGITTNPQIIAKVMELLSEADPHLLPSVTPATRRQRKLQVVKNGPEAG